MCNANQELLIAELEQQNQKLRYRIEQLERAQKYYPGFPAPGPGQREFGE